MTQSLQSNSELSHYRIISKLGAGGMGEVWLAQDTKLDRKVALKILPSDVASNKDRMDRFVREAKSAAALNHPNIAHVYEIGESEGTHFIAMEFIDGETLREKIHRDKAPLSKLLKYLTQVASGLAKAHSIGIVHRDLKPDNIMITRDDYAKVLDFGLAKLVEPQRDAEIGGHGDAGKGSVGEDQTIAMSPRLGVSASPRLPTLSTPGIVIGTIGYMSPEQASGRTNEIDHRSDIFSFGCILFEAATGKRAFEGKDALDSLHKIVHAPTPQLKDINPLAPDDLQRVVRRCLAKEPEKRYQSVKEVAIEIDDLQESLKSGRSDYSTTPASTAAASPSGASRVDEGFWIAVLPFRYRGSNVDLEALADGLTEDIVAGLSRFPYLRVVARSSTLSYTGDGGDVRSTARELGARYVMEGSLRQAGTTIRVSAQLVDTHTGAYLWAETYDRAYQPDEIFAIQDDLIPRIVSTCADHFGVLARSISDSVRLKDLSQVTPYEALMLGFGYHHRLIPEEHARAREALEKAVTEDPGNTNCWAMLSWIYSHEYAHGYNAQPGSLDRALEAAKRAVDFGPSNHFAYQTLAVALFFRKDVAGCLSAAEKSTTLNPLDASNESIFLITLAGDWERGCDLIRRAMDLNPHHPGWYGVVLGINEYRKANYRAAVDQAIKANVRGIFWTNLLLTAGYAQLGELEQAQKALRELLAQKPDFVESGRELIAKWFQPDLVDQLMDGFCKADLQEIPNEPKTLRPIRNTVGRETEHHELREAFGAAMGGRGSLVCVAGEPGIGKTTLVEDFLAEVSSTHQCTIARGRCSERLAGTEAYLPFLEALQNLLQHHGDFLSPLLKRLAPTWYGQFVPQFGGSEVSLSSLEDIKAASQERMKRELATFLQEASQVQPLILFFDDLHWADISTVDLINFVATKIDKLKLLIVVTYRPSDMLLVKHPFLQIKLDLQARGLCHELLLEFLSEGEIADYLRLEFSDNRFPREFAKLIHMKTEGSPLFMADLLRYLRDRKVIAETSGAWHLERALPDIERELPESVRAMIDRKIAQLTDEDRNLLTVAGVQGYEFDSAVISQVLKLEADEVEERLERLERVYSFVQLVSESEFPNRTLTLKYRFIHVLYQNALHNAIRATRKATLSREVASTLEEFYGEQTRTRANELAALYEAGREWMKAADYYHLAADHACVIFGFQEAIALARRGIEALSSIADSLERAELELRLQVTLGLSLRSTKGFAHSETGKAYERARELCNQIGDSPQLFSVLFGLWETRQNNGRLNEATELAAEMLEEAGEDPFLLVAAHDVTGDNLMWMGDFRRSREHLEKGIALYDFDLHKSSFARFGYDTGMACLSMNSITLWHLGYSEEALRMSEESLSLATKLDHPPTLAYATDMAAWFHVLNGSIVKALAFAEDGIAISTKYEHSLFLALAKVVQAWALLRQRKTDQGITLAIEGINFWRDTTTQLGTSWIKGILAEGYGQAGRFNEALDLCSEALNISAKHGEYFYEAELYRLRGELQLKKEDAAEAEKSFQQAIEISSKQSAKRFELRAALSLARLWQHQRKSTEAKQLLGEIYGWFTEGLDTPDLQDARSLLKELGKVEKDFTGKRSTSTERVSSESSRDSFGSPISTIAVLPFQNLSADPDQEFFADGITEEIINTLAQIAGLRVAGRSSSFSFKGRNEDLRSVGAKLNVTTILEGTLRRAGNRLRITAQLIDAASGYQLWSERYDRVMEDVFAVQDEIANKIAGRLQLSLVPGTSQVAPPTKHIRAYELYLKGRGLLYQRGLSIPKAIDCFTQAVSLDPEYAQAWAGLADGYTTSGYSGFNRPVEVMPRALDAAERALQLDPDLAEAHNAHACASLLYSRDYDLAAKEFQRALELSPHYPQARSWYGLFYLHWIAGREQEGRDELFRLLRVDPLSGYANVIFSFSGYTSDRLEEAVEHGRRGVELDPGSYLAQWCLSVALKCSGRYEEAAAAVDRALSLSGRHCWALATLVSINAAWGKLDKATQGYDELLDRSGREYIQPSMLIEAAAAVEQIDQAIRYAQQALDDRDPLFVLLARLWPAYDPLRNDSRFLGIIEQLSLPNWSIGGQGS